MTPTDTVWLAAPKTADSLFLRAGAVGPGLALERMPSRTDAPELDHKRWLGVRAAAISASYILASRAATDLDIDPDELDVLETRLYGGEGARRCSTSPTTW